MTILDAEIVKEILSSIITLAVLVFAFLYYRLAKINNEQAKNHQKDYIRLTERVYSDYKRIIENDIENYKELKASIDLLKKAIEDLTRKL